MPHERFGFVVYSLEELHERLKEELARNPFLKDTRRGTDEPHRDDPPAPQDDSDAPS